MEVLGFKDWFEHKEKSASVSRNTKSFLGERVDSMLYRINSKVLTLHLDNIGTEPIKTSNRVDRYLIDDSSITDLSLEALRKYLIKEKASNRRIFLVGYDTSTDDSKKSFRSAKRLVEGFNKKLGLDFIITKSFGNIEKMNDLIPNNNKDFNKTRIEVWSMSENLDPIEKEMPFSFNPNDYTLLERYKASLKGLLYRLILVDNQEDIRISSMKSWTTSKGKINESSISEENVKIISLLQYTNPNKLSTTDPENKPKVSSEKITNQELTEKRANSICSYLNKYADNYNFKFIPQGLGILEGASKITIEG